MILKQEDCSIRIYIHFFLYSYSHFDLNKSKKCSRRKKNLPYLRIQKNYLNFETKPLTGV